MFVLYGIGEGVKAQNPNKSNRKKVIGHVFDSIRREDIHIRKLLAKQQKGSDEMYPSTITRTTWSDTE